MPTLDLQVSATDADDGHSYNAGATFVSGTSTLSVGKGGNDSQWLMAWQRFTSVAIPARSTIMVAYLQERTPNSDTDNPSLRIYAEDVDDAVAPTDATDRQGKVNTTAYTDWVLDDSVAGEWDDSPSLVTVIQEIVDRPGWVSGNAIQFLINNNGSGTNVIRLFSTGGTEPTYAGKLHVEFTLPSTGRAYPLPRFVRQTLE
jgi:hypothetical protein